MTALRPQHCATCGTEFGARASRYVSRDQPEPVCAGCCRERAVAKYLRERDVGDLIITSGSIAERTARADDELPSPEPDDDDTDTDDTDDDGGLPDAA